MLRSSWEDMNLNVILVILELLVCHFCLKLNCFGDFQDDLTGKFDGNIQIQTSEIVTRSNDI